MLCDSLYEEDIQDAEDDAKQVWNYLRAVMYNRRNKMNPLWNGLIVARFGTAGDSDEDECFLGQMINEQQKWKINN